jgi:hypothetical protein
MEISEAHKKSYKAYLEKMKKCLSEKPDRYMRVRDEDVFDNMQWSGDFVLYSKDSGNIRVIGRIDEQNVAHGRYADEYITCEGAAVVIVTRSTSSGYYARVFGGRITVMGRELPATMCYHIQITSDSDPMLERFSSEHFLQGIPMILFRREFETSTPLTDFVPQG